MIRSKYILYSTYLLFTILTFVYSDVPFFWDGTFFSEMALDLYNNTSNPFHITEGLDNVTFPFYSTYIWLVWSIFSKSLLISHLAMLPFLLGTCYQFYSLSKKFLEEKWLGFAMILLALEPTFMTQSIIMSYDVILVFLFLFLLNKLLEKKYQAYSFILPVLALYSIRGLFLAFSLGMIYFFIARMQKDLSFSKILKHHIWCIVLVISWFIYHKMKTGWFIFSPLHEHSDNQVLPFSMMLKQLAYITWKIADFGRIFLWLFVIFGFIFLKKILPEKN